MDPYHKTTEKKTVKRETTPVYDDDTNEYAARYEYVEPPRKSKKAWWLLPLLLIGLLGLIFWALTNEENDAVDVESVPTTVTVPKVDANAPTVPDVDVDAEVNKVPDNDSGAK